MNRVGDNHTVAAATEPSLTLSVKVPSCHTCHRGALKASVEIPQLWPAVHTPPRPSPPPQPGSLCEWSSLRPFLCPPAYYPIQVLTSFKSIVRINFLLPTHSGLYALFAAMAKPVETGQLVCFCKVRFPCGPDHSLVGTPVQGCGVSMLSRTAGKAIQDRQGGDESYLQPLFLQSLKQKRGLRPRYLESQKSHFAPS